MTKDAKSKVVSKTIKFRARLMGQALSMIARRPSMKPTVATKTKPRFTDTQYVGSGSH